MMANLIQRVSRRVRLARLVRGSARLDRRYLEWEYEPEHMEAGEAPYRWRDALELAGDVDVACALVDCLECEWQHPETLLEEWATEGIVERLNGRYRIAGDDEAKPLCPKCGGRLLPSENPDYRFQCFCCDEDFYGFEAVYGG